MKRVLFNTRVLHVEDLNDSYIIGVEIRTTNKGLIRGQLVKVGTNKYVIVEIGAINDDYINLIQEGSIQLLLARLESNITKVNTFDDKRELLEWLIKN